MSLLIKALDKAQAEKAQGKSKATKKNAAAKAKPEKQSKRSKKKIDTASASALALVDDVETEPNDIPAALKGSAAEAAQKEIAVKPKVLQPQPVSTRQAVAAQGGNISDTASPAQAAIVFSAKGAGTEKQDANTKLILIAAASLLAMLLVWLAYSLLGDTQPEIVIPPRPLATQEMPAPLSSAALSTTPENLVEEIEPLTETVVVLDATESEVKEIEVEEVRALAQEEMVGAEDAIRVERSLKSNETLANTNQEKLHLGQVGKAIASDSVSIQTTSQKQSSGVDPVLMRAYEAYRAGNDSEAQQGYKQVLRRYGKNVDAMLGLGAIAARQGRMADANDWYGKVLAVEPRNVTAKAGLLDAQQQNGVPADESSIKSMIASDPGNANLYASLGGLYAANSQWAAAQQAYFDAHRLSPNADNAFNLAVSLDQMGKSALALTYYQEALSKAGLSSTIDTAGLEARITSIEAIKN